MKCVLLAAGKGTRLGVLTQTTPKPMLPLEGEPVMQHIIKRVAKHGCREFIIVVRYLADIIKSHFGDGSDLGIEVKYAHQPEIHGTGAALQSAEELVAGSPFIMTFGDILTSDDLYQKLIDRINQGDCKAVTALKWVEDPYKGAAVMIDETGIVNEIIEKPEKGSIPSHWMNAGIFAFDPIIFDYLKKLKPSARGEYELPDAINMMIAEGLPVASVQMEDAPWLDIGTPEDLAEARRRLAEGTL